MSIEGAPAVAASSLTEVTLGSVPPGLFRLVLSSRQFEELVRSIKSASTLLEGRIVWNINSTALGGGVAEMLRGLLPYARGAGIDARWLVASATPDFFRLTKRLHNQLHGFPGDGGNLGHRERALYEKALEPASRELAAFVRPGDVVLLHDPQTAGLIRISKHLGARVVWRCHIGSDTRNHLTDRAWRFLAPDLAGADAFVFSRRAFAWEGVPASRVHVVPPSIDPFGPKNRIIGHVEAAAILNAARVLPDPSVTAAPTFVGHDATLGVVSRRARMVEGAPLPTNARIVVQVSRWDRLKDPLGVLRGFVEHVAGHVDAHLVLAGPEVTAVADDPEGAEVLNEAIEAWQALPAGIQAGVHLAILPMHDPDENAAIVNALQRRADVVVQKSLAEGFGLTVVEAMWKSRPVVASRVGGIQDQVEHGVSGLLLNDPTDLHAYGVAVLELLEDPERAAALGAAAHERVREHFLGDRHLKQYGEIFSRILVRRRIRRDAR